MSDADWNRRMFNMILGELVKLHEANTRDGFEGQVILKMSYTRPGGVLNQTFDLNNRVHRVEK